MSGENEDSVMNKRPASSPLQHEAKRPCGLKLPDTTPEWAKDMFSCFLQQFEMLTTKIETITPETASAKVDAVNLRVDELAAENKALKLKVNILESKFEDLSRKVTGHEVYSRKCNLEFHGIKEVPDESANYCEKKVKDLISGKMGLETADIQFARCHRLPRRKPEGMKGDRPVLVRFERDRERDKVWEKRFQLKGSDVYMCENYPEEIEMKRKVWYPIVKKSRAMQSYRNKVFIVDDKLIIDKDDTRTEYSVDELNKIPEDLNPSNLCCKSEGNVIAFFGRGSPLSNHHPAQFEVEGQKYNCVEQFYYFKMAEMDNDERTMYKILAADDPVKQKKIAKKLEKSNKHNNESWQNVAPNIMRQGVAAKFTQNEHLKEYLLSTGDKMLVEANQHDKFWAIGQGLRSENLFRQQFWEGKNFLGKILEQVRSQL